jgi:enoyl-CoA hydratase/carnithine racemase
MNKFIQVARQDQVTEISLNRADQANRLTNSMAAAIAAGLDQARESALIVISATGPDFCLGRDMQPPPPGSDITALDVLREDAGPIIALYDAFRRCQQPVLCAVEGRAWGIGMVIAAMADITVASDQSTFRLRELERGIPPCIAMAPLLDKMPSKALGYLVYSAGEMDAAAALTAGIVSHTVKAGTAGDEVKLLIQGMLAFPKDAIAAVKQYLTTAPRNHEAHAALYGASLLANVLASR